MMRAIVPCLPPCVNRVHSPGARRTCEVLGTGVDRAAAIIGAFDDGGDPTTMCLRIALTFIAAVAAGPTHALTFLTEENPPLNYTEGGRITGYATDVVNEIGRRARVPVKLEVMPWSKAFVAAQAGRDTCVYATARLENRETLFQGGRPVPFPRAAVDDPHEFPG